MTPGKPKILCVDDAPVNLQILDNLLAPRGYEVHTATDGLAALEIITQEDMDLVLLDVMMPEINGFEVCRWLKEQEKFRDIPVVMITALNSTQDRIQGIEAGAADFITKPFDQGEVLARTRMLLRMKELQDARKAAYAHIDHLTGVGEAIIRDFHPLQFSLEEQMDRVMAQFLGETSEAANRPQTVIPCCSCNLPMGNINETSLADIWNGPAYRAFRRQTITRPGLYAMSQRCDCAWCNYTDNDRVNRIFKWIAPFCCR